MGNEIRQIAIYGKGGIGKSTIAANVAAALQEMGRRVMQVGCSPKVDSTSFLLGGEPQKISILEHSRDVGVNERTIFDCVEKGYMGIYCAEAGGPEPAEGCAGRGSALALDLLKKYEVFEKLGIDFVIYDVIGDVVCGGFAQPMRSGYAREIYLVTSGELMSLYSSNNICIAINDLSRNKADVGVAGIINNMRNVEHEKELVDEFSERIGVPVMANIPRSSVVQDAEKNSGTVMEKFPGSEQAEAYRKLAKNILENDKIYIPNPLSLEDLMGLFRKYEIIV